MIEPILSSDTSPDAIPPVIIELGQTKAERNRLFVILVGLIIVLIIALSFCWYSFDKAQTNKEIMYVKMFPNGTWENVEYHAQDKQLFFKTTVDSLITQYTEKRFGVIPMTVASDYGEAQVFMDNDLHSEFIAKNGFDAVDKAHEFANSHNYTKIKWRFNNHTSQTTGVFNGIETQVMRTDVYFTKEQHISGQVKKSRMMLSISWRLLPKTELEKQDKDFLRVNPIGLKIITQKLTLEPNQ